MAGSAGPVVECSARAGVGRFFPYRPLDLVRDAQSRRSCVELIASRSYLMSRAAGFEEHVAVYRAGRELPRSLASCFDERWRRMQLSSRFGEMTSACELQ